MRPPGLPPLPHPLLRRDLHRPGTGATPAGRRVRIPRHHRPQPERGVRRRAHAGRPGPPVRRAGRTEPGTARGSGSSRAWRRTSWRTAALDYDEALLARLDFVIASIHTRFGMDEEEMTERVLQRPGPSPGDHPRPSHRPPAAVAQSLRASTSTGSSSGRRRTRWPSRSTPIPAGSTSTGATCPGPWRPGVTISIGADAHSLATMKNVELGVAMARKGWLRREDVLNTRPVEGFLEFARKGNRT